MMNFKSIKEIENKHFFNVFSRIDACMVKGKGVNLKSSDGKKYTDFLSGIAVCCLGYSDKGFKKAIIKQTKKLLHTSNYFYIESQSKLLKNLNIATGYDRAFITNSGAEAVEAAIKLARKYFYNRGEDKTEIISFKGSFHGRTLATLAATGQEKFHEPYKPLIRSFKYVDYKDIDALQKAISDKTCGVLIEPVLGEGGVIPAGAEYYKKVKQLCKKHGILMIADEIQTGVGRAGSMLASSLYGVKPDIVTLAKSLGNGLPIGAVLATNKVAKAFSLGDHGSTFGGNHLACAGAAYVIEKMISTDIIKENADKGEYFLLKLKTLLSYDKIKEVRGIGLMLGVEFKKDFDAKYFQKKLFENGFIAAIAGNNTLRFLPPYIITKKHIDELISELDKIISL
jgi:acetylornithine/N-succinyldiaminopimelate aminotransferase